MYIVHILAGDLYFDIFLIKDLNLGCWAKFFIPCGSRIQLGQLVTDDGYNDKDTYDDDADDDDADGKDN